MSNYHIRFTECAPLGAPANSLSQFSLCHPQPGVDYTLKQLSEQGLLFEGSLLGGPALKNSPLFLEQAGARHYFNLVPVPLTGLSGILQQLTRQVNRWHFRFTLPLSSADFSLGILIDEQHITLLQGKVEGSFSVLVGKEGWLFLDNDTNKSVEQFTGKLMLGSAAQAWQQYFSLLIQFTHQQGLPYALLIAPAKEQVFPEYYPYAKSGTTIVKQLIELRPTDFQMVYPVKRLRRARLRSYRLTDTHWSPYGACIASRALAVQLGLSWYDVKMVFVDDRYYTMHVTGDLGNKFYPPVTSKERFLRNYSYRRHLVYDNGLANFGRVLITFNLQALQQARVVIFGSSSAYSMLDYLSRLFSEVILIHSAGNIDTELTLALKPDYLVAQTNGRFVVKAPEVGYSLQQVMYEKLQMESVAGRKNMLLQSEPAAATSELSSVAILKQVLIRALASLKA